MKNNSIKNIALKFNLNKQILIRNNKYQQGELVFTLEDGRSESMIVNSESFSHFIELCKAEAEKRLVRKYKRHKPVLSKKLISQIAFVIAPLAPLAKIPNNS